ncbi:NrfD/PsrC family molybdoenzyme membrane anchor subunit [uncultured Paludibaculum sp.]|uniref:NrfD/PsrC family molybdoenzyme membrane anchor subunit n=1 Tax=uncultured Paludibaculum sp. TaxID=1765020 RepID=UPI002AAA882B|nr:Ni/Fe-hydrogenase cytochrome b subunit [uncultured Paludibaculum sp.]
MSNALRTYFWRASFAVIMLVAAYATFVRFYYGLGASTNLSDQFPWGIWVGFDVLCGVGLAAGGFTLAAIVHIFNLKSYKAVVRPAILTAFLGYLLVTVALMFDLGRPYRVWHPLIMWNPRSVMFEVGWCVTLYTSVLFLEFLPMVLEKLGLVKAHRVLKGVMLPIIILGVILSTLHQSSLGSVFLIMPTKLHPLWYSPLLPVLFYVSAIATGLAMTIFESWHSAKAFGRQLEFPLVQKMTRVLAVVIAVYLTMRFLDLYHRGAMSTLNNPGWERWLFGLEIVLMAVPMLMFFRERTRQNPQAIYVGTVLFLLGFVTHRLNVSVTGLEASSGVHYIPKWTEVSITLAMVAAGFFVFRMAAHYLPVFEPEEHAPVQAVPVLEDRDYAHSLARGD